MKSIPRFNPRTANEPTLTAMNTAAMIAAFLPNPMKSNDVLDKKLRVALFEKLMFLSFFNQPSNTKREMKIDVNNDVAIPIINVVAKP